LLNKITPYYIRNDTQNLQTMQKQKEQPITFTNVDTDNSKNYPLITRDQIPNTPFWIVGNEEQGYRIVWGKYTFTQEPHKSIDEAVVWFDTHQWEVTLHIVSIAMKIASDLEHGKNQPPTD